MNRHTTLCATAAALLLLASCQGAEVDGSVLERLEVPGEHTRGAAVYFARCAVCHGELALGTEIGPPLVHPVYRSRHHGDDAFRLAVSQGVRAHHWRFGDMPAVPDVPAGEVDAIIGYVRWLQQEAGID